MSKTPAPRVRQTNLYTVEQDGQPVAQAMAISQAEAVRLYVESVQQPTMSARLSSPMEARALATLPLLQREPAAVDTRTADLFEATPAVDHVEHILAMVPPQHAPIEAVTDGLASGAEDQPGEEVAGDCAEPASPPADASPASVDAPTVWLDDVALTARKSDAFHAGFELGKRGLKRLSDEMLTVEMDILRAAHGRVDADAVHCELLRGFEDGRAQAEPVGTQERRRLPDAEPKGAGKVAAKYRNPDDGSTWSGRA